MRKFFILISIIFLSSCSSGLYTLKQFSKKKDKREIEVIDINDFNIYSYNICEDIRTKDSNNRFCNCPGGFYEIKNSSLKKVEEVYLLIHNSSDLVLYFTTFSHKYIKQNEGFLNDKSIYQNHIVLDQVEYIYIGKKNVSSSWIHFPSDSKKEDIIIHFDKDKFPDEIFLKEANIATAENNYSIGKKIDLSDVFKDDIVYKKNNIVDLVFYKNNSSIGKVDANLVKCINIVSDDGGKIYIVFGCGDRDNLFYKITSKRIKYKPNFYLIKN